MVIRNGTFAWGHGEEDGKPILEDLNMTAEKGSLVAVVGSVGAGKSSLCSAILGEMEKQRGFLNVRVSTNCSTRMLDTIIILEKFIWLSGQSHGQARSGLSCVKPTPAVTSRGVKVCNSIIVDKEDSYWLSR